MARTRTKTPHILPHLGAVDMEASPPPVPRQEKDAPSLEKLKTRARDAAQERGHRLGYFTTASSIAVMARCDRCGRCAVVAPSRWATDGIGFGGRATREACTTTSTLTLGRTKEERIMARTAAKAARKAAKAAERQVKAARTQAHTAKESIDPTVLARIDKIVAAAARQHKLLDFNDLREHVGLSVPVFRATMRHLAADCITRKAGDHLFVVVHHGNNITGNNWLFGTLDEGDADHGPRIPRWHAALKRLGFPANIEEILTGHKPWTTFAEWSLTAKAAERIHDGSGNGRDHATSKNGAADQAPPKPAAKAKAKVKAKVSKPVKKTAPTTTSASA